MRKRRRDAKWWQLFEQKTQSRLSGQAFCQQRRLLAKTLYRQRKFLEQMSLVPVGQALIKVQPIPVQSSLIQPAIEIKIYA